MKQQSPYRTHGEELGPDRFREPMSLLLLDHSAALDVDLVGNHDGYICRAEIVTGNRAVATLLSNTRHPRFQALERRWVRHVVHVHHEARLVSLVGVKVEPNEGGSVVLIEGVAANVDDVELDGEGAVGELDRLHLVVHSLRLHAQSPSTVPSGTSSAGSAPQTGA